jgi:hypothetical protein
MDAQVASELHFGCFTYAQKDNATWSRVEINLESTGIIKILF